ncbi:MAG TPA: hypothetical protein VM536_17485 [Chloroflexia bacterium]|nr:hypothetical protein [Chloroflexia bacterium]
MHSFRRLAYLMLLACLLVTSACGQAGGTGQIVPPTATEPGVALSPSPATTGSATPADGTPGSTPAPIDPYSVYSPLALIDVSAGVVVVKSDLINLDGTDPKEALLTVSAPPTVSATGAVPLVTLPYTNTRSALAVAGYDAAAQKWQVLNRLPGQGVAGRAAPLPAAAQGGNPLGATPPLPVIQLRTETTPTLASGVPTINLHLYTWRDGALHPLAMRRAGAATDEDAVFTGAADAQLLDVDGDGRAEVLVDAADKTTIWQWDGTRFVPR